MDDAGGIDVLKAVKRRYAEDASMSAIIQDVKQYKNFTYGDGLLVLHDNGRRRLCVPEVLIGERRLKEILISHAHSLLAHLGTYKTLNLLKDYV